MLKPQINMVTIFPHQYEGWLAQFSDFLNIFLKTCPDSHKKNYQTTDWQNSTSSFLKCVYIDQRYENGVITVAQQDDKVVALSACYAYSEKLYYIGSRSSVLPGYEGLHLVSSYLIPTQQKFLKQKAEYGFISFNTDDFSLKLMKSFKKRDKWTAAKVKRLSGLGYIPFSFIDDRTFTINGCEQYVAYYATSPVKSADREDFISQLTKDIL